MKVNFDDTEKNWRLWGDLVQLWIYGRHEKPSDTAKLVNEMAAHGITNPSVWGPQRKVEFYSYDENDPLEISLPKPAMVEAAQEGTHDGQPYPLPVFYDRAYEGKRRPMSKAEQKDFANFRIGEYTINNCG